MFDGCDFRSRFKIMQKRVLLPVYTLRLIIDIVFPPMDIRCKPSFIRKVELNQRHPQFSKKTYAVPCLTGGIDDTAFIFLSEMAHLQIIRIVIPV